MTITTATVPDLTTALSDFDPSVRLRAAMELGLSADPAAASVLVEALGPELNSRVRGMITWATVQHADEALPRLVALLDDADPAVRHQVLHVLSKIARPEVLPHVLPLVADPDPQVAIKAYRAAATSRDPQAVPALVEQLGTGDAEQRDQLVRNLKLLAPWSVDALVAATWSTDVDVRAHAVDALAEIGSPDADSAVSALVERLSDADADIRLGAVCALGELDSDEARQALTGVAAGDDTVLASVASRLIG